MNFSTVYIDYMLPNNVQIGSSNMYFCIDSNDSLHVLTNILYLFDNVVYSTYIIDILVDDNIDNIELIEKIKKCFTDFIYPIYKDVSCKSEFIYDEMITCPIKTEIPQCKVSELSEYLHQTVDKSNWSILIN